MQVSIIGMQNNLKAIPILQDIVKYIEENLKLQQNDVDSCKKTTATLEISVTNTQKAMAGLGKYHMSSYGRIGVYKVNTLNYQENNLYMNKKYSLKMVGVYGGIWVQLILT